MTDTLTYTGTKTVQAKPATMEADGVHHDGYEVRYEDGYVSWSPKAVFEQHYKLSGTWQERLRIEHDELEARTKKLDEFLSSPDRAQADVEALEAQLGIMQTLLAVLSIRLEDAQA